MPKRNLFRALCWMMVIAFPVSTVLADSNAAMLQTTGMVRVNDSAVNRSAAVFQGDRIATGKESSAAITAVGTSILVAPASALLYEGKWATITAGSAHFNGLISVRAGAITISSDSATARFEVHYDGAQVRVTSLEGNLSVSDGKQVMLLESGKSMVSGKLPAVPRNSNSIAGGPIIGFLLAVVLAASLGAALTDDNVSNTSP
ncbi:MAG: hypothetical protein L0099_06525 [Acidobacteria bacterium]|nr:hypothetical protein [Acidobacteriota bacterium]